MRTAPLMLVVLIAGGCAAQDATPDARPMSDAHPRDGARVDAARLADGGALCPTSFTPCGGDVVGKWSLLAVCPAGGVSLSKPCDHPYGDLPACTGSGNEAICTNVYGGTITLAADGKSTVAMSLHGEMAITFSGACVLAVAGGTSAVDSCRGLVTRNGKQLDCTFSSGVCSCRISTEPQTETKNDVYQVSGTELVVTPSVGEKIGGPYCITGDQLVMRGVIGWAYWVLRRIP